MSNSERNSLTPDQSEDNSSLVVEVQRNSFALSAMERLLKNRDAEIKKHVYFPLDDRIFKYNDTTSRNYKKLRDAILSTFHSTATYDRSVVGIYIEETKSLDSVILLTRNGWLYGIYKHRHIHEKLRDFCERLKPVCGGWCISEVELELCNGMCNYKNNGKAFELIGEDFAIIFLPQFVHDKTHLRRAKLIGEFHEFTYFLELETGTIRRIRNTFRYKTIKSKLHVFSEPSSISQFRLENAEATERRRVLYQGLTIAKTKKIKIIRHEQHSKDEWLPIAVTEVSEVSRKRRRDSSRMQVRNF